MFSRSSKASRVISYILGLPGSIPWLGMALVAGLFYLGVSAWRFGYVGFPLDDAWIHQTYARNLAQSGQLAFVPGIPSAGSTSPLWTLLLSLGYLLWVPFQPWTYGLGILFLGLTGWTVQRLGQRLFPETHWASLWAGIFCILEWHLVWAAVSGMETILFTWLSLFLFERYLNAIEVGREGQNQTGGWAESETPLTFNSGVILGISGGLLILTRPEGLGLVGLIGLDIARRWWRRSDSHEISDLLQHWTSISLGVIIMVIPYIIFHLRLTGLPFPNTLYAKQAEYGEILSSFPIWWRLFGGIGPTIETVQGVFRVIFIGPQLLLLPGLVTAGWFTLRERRWEIVPAWAWWISYLLLYGLRLPVTYQHGRYQIPTIAWVVLLSIWGTARLIRPSGNRSSSQSLLLRVASRSLVMSLAILVLAFTVVGAQAYGRDVRFIESEMVATAKWLDENIGPDVLIAAHDIGAIGYFTQESLIDLAGLVTPEVIPFIRNEAMLFEFMLINRANYLVTFPSWYPEMIQSSNLTRLYSTQAPWSPQAGGDNMTVYRIELSSKP